MIVIGLTGSIGMGKSTLCQQFSALGAKCISADDIVHQLLAKDGAGVEPVGKAFKGVVKNGAVDRPALRPHIFGNDANRKKLEAILHPLVVEAEERFVERMMRLGAETIVMDIPLLFETGAEARCDVTVVATAPYLVQRARVLRRKGMNENTFKAILRAQMPDGEKRLRADFVVQTGLGKAYSFRMLQDILQELQ